MRARHQDFGPVISLFIDWVAVVVMREFPGRLELIGCACGAMRVERRSATSWGGGRLPPGPGSGSVRATAVQAALAPRPPRFLPGARGTRGAVAPEAGGAEPETPCPGVHGQPQPGGLPAAGCAQEVCPSVTRVDLQGNNRRNCPLSMSGLRTTYIYTGAGPGSAPAGSAHTCQKLLSWHETA